ncbi:estradiol 17-beta-dehydrogenase 8 [Lingula anatina]|uniref:(3R)-3-hydroxyacyl-CoA dehydrogenase n=1 Tax=Lingula anatina TaxID=7574 RepID=A0A1S3JCP3_LINAN|nr:estradiol 17-beta-dehydrogenase 8 [Lingula anatina]|eukprot:XP_013408093.1 estradiol 17-beta-dehydrogenase 8 [Lingula anatina]
MATAMLSGRIALVTGAGSGIGRAVCQVLAREGAAVAAVDINQTSAEKTVGDLQPITSSPNCHHPFAADVSDSKVVEDLVGMVKKMYEGVPSILVNAAGITRDNFLLKLDEKSFDEVIKVNLKGTYLMTKAIAQLMVENSQPGSIVNIASIVGKVGNIGQANYAASKSGLEGLTKTVAKEMGRYGIRCNAVLPGFIDTPMTEAVPEKVIDNMRKMIPAGRTGKPEEVAEACLFLASDRSSYVTGISLEVAGGLFM